MLSVDEAQARLTPLVVRSRSHSTPLDTCLGRVLAVSVATDRPTPPFDRVCMDGYALRCADATSGAVLPIAGQARAGAPTQEAPPTGCVLEVATGAPLPYGCDTVVPYEKTQKQRLDNRVGVTLLHTPVPGENIQARGSEAPQGKEVLKIGTRIGAAEMGILASVGEIRPKVFSVPRLAICSTGDELVPPESIPLVHQIRQSNAPALISLLAQHGLVCHTTRHAPDHAATLRQELSELLQSHDVVILSGGVSMGKWDYVPQILQELGVREHLHTIAQKPGKPMWVGVGPDGQLVFGLPGNPVAALVCARRWVIPTLLRSLGQNVLQARLQTDLKRLEKLTRFVIVQTHEQEATRWVSGLPSQGSGDYLALAHSSGFCVIPPGSGNLPAGSLVDFYPW